jgi:hypothetical protein
MFANAEASNCMEEEQPQSDNNSISESFLVKLSPDLWEMLVLFIWKLVHPVDVVH